ncbi:MAG: Methyltransferase domain protein [Pelotomaculum sp. PtaB.Bin104]|nr:MAG: Methyltransferase domain protein [Pelotomaculum sp. PtaB.Bin104]
MTNNKRSQLKQIENIFINYYKKIGVLEDQKKDIKNYLSKFLRERFVERILFTVMSELENIKLAEKSILITGLSHELASVLLKWGAVPDNITVADLCPQAIKKAKALFSSSIKFSKISLDKFSFNDDDFDIIVCFNYLSNIPVNEYIEKLAAEFYRVIKPGGVAFISFTNEIASYEDMQLSGLLRTYQPEEILPYFKNYKLINLLHFFPYNFDLFFIENEHVFPKKIGYIEDILIEQNHRYTDSLLLLTK